MTTARRKPAPGVRPLIAVENSTILLGLLAGSFLAFDAGAAQNVYLLERIAFPTGAVWYFYSQILGLAAAVIAIAAAAALSRRMRLVTLAACLCAASLMMAPRLRSWSRATRPVA